LAKPSSHGSLAGGPLLQRREAKLPLLRLAQGGGGDADAIKPRGRSPAPCIHCHPLSPCAVAPAAGGGRQSSTVASHQRRRWRRRCRPRVVGAGGGRRSFAVAAHQRRRWRRRCLPRAAAAGGGEVAEQHEAGRVGPTRH
jgi:hypothetical protein